MEKKLTDEEVIEVLKNCGAGIHSSNRECRNCVLEDDGRCVNNLRKYSLDLIHRLQEESKDLRQKKNELQTLIRESRHSQSTAKEILQAMFYFLDGNSFWLEETGREVEYVKLDDALEFMRKQAKEYFVEVEE